MAPCRFLGLTTATTFVDSLSASFEPVVEYQVPTNAEPNSATRLLDHPLATIQPTHASQSITHFPDCYPGFIQASVVDGGYSLELSYRSMSRNEVDDKSHPPVQFRFQEKIVPTPYLSTNPDDGTLIILVLTQSSILYRLKFTAPDWFYAELFEEDWVVDTEVEAIINRQVILYHGIDPNNLVISTSDGILTHLSWGKLVGIDDTYGWKSSNLSSRSGLWALLPNWTSSKTVSSSAHEWVATPGSAISIASHVTTGGSGEDAWIFTVTRDRKLRVWSLATGECLRELPLGLRAEIGSLADDQQPRRHPGLLPAASRSLARFIYSDEGDDASYEGFLVVFVPSAHAPSFITYGMSMTNDHRFSNLILLEERVCDFGVKDLDGPATADLRDFTISRTDLAHHSSSLSQNPWALWTIWNDEVGGEGIIRTVLLHETRTYKEIPRSDWITIRPPDRATPWNSTYFDDLLAANPGSSVSEVFIDHLFKPGNYSFSTLEYALEVYEESLFTEEEEGAGGRIVDEKDQEGRFESLEEKIISVVGSDVKLEISPMNGSPMMDVFHRKLRIEWLKFAAMCTESRSSALWPLELAVDTDRHLVLVMGRRSITSTVFIDTVSLVAQVAREEAAGLEPVLLRHHQQLPELDRLHPMLTNLNTRTELVKLINTVQTLILGIPGVEFMKPFEDELIQIIKRPAKFGLVDLAEDLFSRRLEPFIDNALQSKVSDKLKSIADLGLTLEILWVILTSADLINTDSSSSSPSSSNSFSPTTTAFSSPTILSQMLITDYLINAIETRYQLTLKSVALLLYIYGEEELEETFVSSERFAVHFSKYLKSFHQAFVTRWVASQASRVSSELLDGVEMQEDERDVLVEKLGTLNVSRTWTENGDDRNDVRSATGLISSLLMTKFIPIEACARSVTPTSISLSQAASRFLDQTGLCPKLSEDHITIITQHQHMVIKTFPKNVQFIHFLLQVGLCQLALELLDMYPDSNAGVCFLRGLALVEVGKVEDDDPNFVSNDESGLVKVLPSKAYTSLKAYYTYIVSLLEPTCSDLSISRFCQLALDNHDPSEQHDHDHQNEELWNKLFKAFVNLRMWDDAYGVLVEVESTEMKHNCLRTLVSSMSEANEIDKLLRFSFLGIQTELERTLSFRARNSDPLSQPNYYQILYAFYVTKGDYRSAALAMYQHGRRIGEVTAKAAKEAVLVLLTQQCQSYLAAINALALVPAHQAWIPIPVPVAKRSLISYSLPASTTGAPDLDLLSLAELRKEYLLALTALELANDLPHLASPAHLDGPTLMPMLVNRCRVRDALERSPTVEITRAIFRTLAESCCRLTTDSAEIVEGFDREWVLADPRASGWEGTIAARGWKLVQLELEGRGDLGSRVEVLEAVLENGEAVKVPIWLLDWFVERDEIEVLARVLISFGYVEDAFSALVCALDKKEQGSKQKAMPIGIIDRLLGLEIEQVKGTTLEEEAKLRWYQDRLKELVNRLVNEREAQGNGKLVSVRRGSGGLVGR